MTRRTAGHEPNTLQELWRTFPLAWRLLQDRQVAPLLKIIPLLAVIYVLFPIDIVPDVIPVAGQLDDVAVLLLALRLFVKLAPPDAVARHSPEFGTTSDRDDDVVDGEWRAVDSDRWKR